VFQESGGLLVMEVESTPANTSWAVGTTLTGYTGSSYYTWTGSDYFGTPGNGILAYTFNIQTPGTYNFAFRNRHDFADSTLENDHWLKLDNGTWVKTYSSIRGVWTWNTNHEFSATNKVPAKYTLTAGQHTLYVSARSRGMSLDRLVFYLPGVNGLDATLPQSPNTTTPPPTTGGSVNISGELKLWHKVTLTADGPTVSESDAANPFRNYRMNVTFTNGSRSTIVPGYFAGDGNAGETSAVSGNKWKAHFRPDATGTWTYSVSFRQGTDIAVSDVATAGVSAGPDGRTGSFVVTATDKSGADFRAHGVLKYVGKHFLQFSGSNRYFLKGGADSPENFLGFREFDGTRAAGGTALHAYAPHAGDWQTGDPSWKGGLGKNIIGALNYLASKGMNSVYFLTMNVNGDGKDVWPWTAYEERYRFDVSKLDQWEIVFDHMERKGMMLHVVLQERENDRLLDGGETGLQRKLYTRELVARFGHHLALMWNLGEENMQSDAQRKAYATYIRQIDPWDHPILIHPNIGTYDALYTPLLGFAALEGPSLQMGDPALSHSETLKWVQRSAQAGRPWITMLDEIGPAGVGVLPDANDASHTMVRYRVLWGNLMAGGAGVEWYFGYSYPHHDLSCEDWRSRNNMWDQTRHALTFFQTYLPFAEMSGQDALTSATGDYCLAKAGDTYAIYLPAGGTTNLDLGTNTGTFTVHWYNPRAGGALLTSNVTSITGPGAKSIGTPPSDASLDWVVLVRRSSSTPPVNLPPARPRGLR
jgi:hypothetical protein